jgi:hypothetical protein
VNGLSLGNIRESLSATAKDVRQSRMREDIITGLDMGCYVRFDTVDED